MDLPYSYKYKKNENEKKIKIKKRALILFFLTKSIYFKHFARLTAFILYRYISIYKYGLRIYLYKINKKKIYIYIINVYLFIFN